MRRPPTSRPLPLLLLLLFFHVLLLLLASPRVSGFQTPAGGDASLVVFSSFPSFATETKDTEGGPRAPTDSVPHVNTDKSHHGLPSDPHRDLPPTTGHSGAEGRAMAGNSTAGNDDAPKTGIFLFSTLMKTSTDAEGLTTLEAAVAHNETSTVPDVTEITASPTDDPFTVPSEQTSSPSSITTRHPRTTVFAQESGVEAQPDEAGKNEQKATEASVAPGSLASMLQRMKSSPRPSAAKPARERKEKEDSPQQMTLAERLKALQARRAARLGVVQTRPGSLFRRNNSPPQARESPVLRRFGDLSVGNSEDEARQQTLTEEPTISFIEPPPESEGEARQDINEPDMVGEEASVVSTVQSESPGPEASSPISGKPAPKKRQRLSYTQRLRGRIQTLRDRRLSSTTPRPRPPRPETIARPRPAPRPRTESNTDGLSLSQRRRNQFYQRLRNRAFTTRAPSGVSVNTPQEKDPEVTSEAPAINQPPKRLSFLPTTKRPLSFREKIQQFRNRNRFIPASLRKQQESTTSSTTTTTTSTTPPPTTVTTTPPPTTIGTTPALAFNTWPVTEAPEDDNFLITVPSTTESSDNSRRFQIRKMIDAMLSSKGSSDPPTTEQVLSLLELATSRPVFMQTTESLLRTLPEHRGTSRPRFSIPGTENKESRSEISLADLLTTITESVSLPTTERSLHGSARDRSKPFQQFPSLSDKLAASHAPKRSKYEPSSTSPAPTTEESSVTTLVGALDFASGLSDETDTDTTTTTLAVETTTPSFSSSTVTDAEEDETHFTTQEPLATTTAEDLRVKNLIDKLLSQGVITVPLPDDSEPVTPSMEEVLLTTTSDALPPTSAPSPSPELPQLTRGAPPSRTPMRSGSPFTDNPLVSTVKMMDTTAKFNNDDVEVTEAPQTTTSDDALLQTTFFQTSLPITDTADSVFDIAGDLEENEIDAVNSKDNLHSLMMSFGRSSIRPELAAVNQVLGFTLTTDDRVSPVEVSLEKPQTPREEDLYDDLEVAATEQVMITTSLRDDDLTPTPLNLDMTTFSVSEPSPQIHSTTEATSLGAAAAAGERHSGTGKEEKAASIKEAGTSVEENPDAVKPVFAIATSEPPGKQMPTTTPPVPDAAGPQGNKKPSGENENVTLSLQNFLRQGASEKADGSPSDSADAFQGVSQAVLRERLHLLRLMKERQGGKGGQETPLERPRTTSESPSTTSRVSLRELIRKKTSGEVTGPGMTMKTSLGEPSTTTQTTLTTGAPEPRPTAATKPAQTQSTSKTNDAMRRFLELNKHVLSALRAKKKAPSTTEATPPVTSTLPTIRSTTRHSIPDLGTESSGSKEEGAPPVITQVTPQPPITTAATPQHQNQPHEGTKVRTSSLLRPVSLLPDINETPSPATHSIESASASNVQRPVSREHEDQLTKKNQGPSTSRPEVTTIHSRVSPPPFRVRRPHPPTKFSLSRPGQDSPEQQQPATSFSPGPSESVAEGPQVVSTTSRPRLHPIIIPRPGAAPATDIAKPDEPSDGAGRPSEVQTERPSPVRVTTLASLLNRKRIPGTRFHQAKQKTTVLSKTTSESVPETTKLPEDDTLAPVTLPSQEETTIIPQVPDDNLQTSAPQVAQTKPSLSDNSIKPPSFKGTISVTEGMTAEDVPPPFTFQDTNGNFRTGLQGRPAGAFKPSVSVGVPLPFPGSRPPHVAFPTTTSPAIQFEPTHIPTRPSSGGAIQGLDTSATTESPSSFPTSPQDLTHEKNTLTPTTLSIDVDTGAPGKPLPFFTATPKPGFASFTLGRNEAFFSDDEVIATTFHPPVTEIPVITTPITTVTPQVILVALPVVNGSIVTGSLLPEEDDVAGRENEQPGESVSPPNLKHMITKGVTITSTEGVIDRVPPTAAPESPSPPHSLLVPPPTHPTFLNPQTEQDSPQNILQREDEELRLRFASDSLSQAVPSEHSLGATEEKKLKGEITVNEQQGRVGATKRPSSLQAGHLNLNELRQHQLAGQVTDRASQGLPTPTGFQEQQIGSQVFLGQSNGPRQQSNIAATGQSTPQGSQQPPRQHNIRGQHISDDRPVSVGPHSIETQHTLGQGGVISNQQTVGVSQVHNEGQTTLGHRQFGNQHVSDQVPPGQHGGVQAIAEQGQTTPPQQNIVNQHTIVQGLTEHGQLITMNRRTLNRRKGVSGHDETVNQQTLVHGQNPGQERTSQHTFSQEQGAPNQQVFGGKQQDTLTQQHSQGRLIQGQQNPQAQGVQNQADQQEQTIQGQHNFQDQGIEGQQHQKGRIIQGQHNQQGQIIQGQHNQQGQITHSQHEQQGQVIQSQHTQQGQTIQSQHEQGQIIQRQPNHHQGEVIQGQHNPQGQLIDAQHNQQAQVIQAQHNPQEHTIQAQHNPQEHTIQAQHNPQEHTIQDQHNPQEHTIQDQHNPQEHTIQDQHNPQEHTIQAQHNPQEHTIQAQHNPQEHTIQDQHNPQEHTIQDQHNPQEHTIQDQHNPQEHTIQAQHNPQEHTIQDQHNPQTQITQAQHDTQELGLHGQHNPQAKTNQAQHNQRGQLIQGQHNQQGQATQGREQGQGQPSLGHQNFQSPQGTHTASEGQQNTHGQQSGHGQDSTQGQNFQGQDVIQGQINQGQGRTQEQASQGQVIQGADVIQGQISQEQGDIVEGQTTPGREVIQEPNIQGQDVTQGQEVTEEPIPTTQATFLEGHSATQNKHELQQDAKQPVSSPPPQHNSRRGKFISGDAVQGAQLISSDRNAGKLEIQNVHPERPIIRGQSVVPPVPARGGVHTTSRGQTRGQNSRNQQQRTQAGDKQRLDSPKSPATLGHFTNSAAGFLRGPANSVIRGAASQRDGLPAPDDEGDFLTTVLPATFKTSGSRLPVGQDSDGDEIPGQAGIDYPILKTIPATAFRCTPAMANMMFADPETSCQVYHVCSGNQKFSFLCPKGTLFNQDTSVCQWWFTVDCTRQSRRLAEVRGLSAG
ncbi:mucin-5AC-like isoform X2 [Eriocheir sinensis]|uniref:mucin-5AC-like isoform X2 n=1 Tax=Eriocheir sinensis TaxID=95602 RepID=UPI0021C93F2F|nr:mucin-5AC-like isoform X2 [Eriocheir sinensis]